jgi:hypothetical protein
MSDHRAPGRQHRYEDVNPQARETGIVDAVESVHQVDIDHGA